MNKKNVLVTAAGSGTAFAYCQSIAKNFPSIKLTTADINSQEFVTSSLYADEHVILSPFKKDQYLNVINRLIKKFNIDYYIPIIDTEIYFASQNSNNISCQVIVNSVDFCQAAVRKSKYDSLFDESALKVPKRLKFDEYLIAEKAVAKKDQSFGGRAVLIKNNQNECNDLDETWCFYEYIDGDEFTIDCFPVKDMSKKVITSVRQRLEVKSGVCTKAKITSDDILSQFASMLVENYNLSHPFCFQTRFDHGHYLIDINPRLGAGSLMSAMNGLDFFSAHIASLIGENPLNYLNPIYQECIVTRQYADYLMHTVT